MSVNKVILIGRLGQNPELRSTPSGASVANFSMATNEYRVDKQGQKQEFTEWHRVVVWGKQAEHCAQYLQKGREVYVEGRLQTRSWQDQNGQTRYTTEVVAQNVRFLGGAQVGAGASHSAHASYAASPESASLSTPVMNTPSSAPAEPSFTEDDIPF